MKAAVVVDGRNVLDPDKAHAAGSSTSRSGARRRASCRGRERKVKWKPSSLRAGRRSDSVDAVGGKPKALARSRATARRVPRGAPRGRRRPARHRQLRSRQGSAVRFRARWARRRDRAGRRARAAGARGWDPICSVGARGGGPIFALNADELIDLDFAALADAHDRTGAAATITVSPLKSAFGVVDLDGDVVRGFQEAPALPYWVNCGIYVLGEEALARFPERGDHERSTFPELAAEGRLRAYRTRGHLAHGEHPEGSPHC